MDPAVVTPVYVTVLLQLFLLLERLGYYLFVWLTTLKKSSCTTKLCGVCSTKMETEEETEMTQKTDSDAIDAKEKPS